MKFNLLFLSLSICSFQCFADSMQAALMDDANTIYENHQKQAKTEQYFNYSAMESSCQNQNIQNHNETVFVFDNTIPKVRCSILEITDIAFEKLERIREVSLGDSTRWNIETAVSGNNDTRREHLIVKPLDINLQTSMVVTTDRRTYHIRLISSKKDFMTAVSFVYPSNRISKLKRQSIQGFGGNTDVPNEPNTAKGGFSVAVNHDDHSKNQNNYGVYDFSGDFDLMPLKAWHDDQRTYIKMDKKTLEKKLPALVLVNSEGFLFQEEKLSTVNYRVHDDTYIVDGIIEHGRLILGSDSDKKSVDIIARG